MALLFAWGIVYGSLYRSLAIGPFIHLAIVQLLVDMLVGEIDRVLAGHLVYLGSSKCGSGLFITSSSHGGSACS